MKNNKIMKITELIVIMTMMLSVFACNSQIDNEGFTSESSAEAYESVCGEKESEETSDNREEASTSENDFDDSSETELSQTEDKSEVTTEEKSEVTTEEKNEETSSEPEDKDYSSEYSKLNSSSGYIGRYIDYIMLDGEKILVTSDAMSAKLIDVNTSNKTLLFRGWAGFEGDVVKLGHAFDNNAPILNTDPMDAEQGVINAAGEKAVRFTVSVDISELSVGYHDFYLLAQVDFKGGVTVKLLSFKIHKTEAIEQCAHNSEENVWSAVAGEPKETATCANCGESITRNTSFILCYEKIIHGGGEKIGNVFTLDSAHVIDDISEAFVTDNGLYFQGWLGINSGTKEYKWSIDGKEWFDVDESSSYRDDSADVLSAIAKKSEENRLGLKNYASKIRFYITVSGISKLPAGNYDVYLGAVPNNNPDTVVPVIQVKNVTVAATPDVDTALKTINGTAISDYTIVIEGNHYGVKRAQELLSKELYLASGIVLPVSNSGIAGTKTILIRSSDTYNNGNVGGGEYYFEINGDSIIIGGSGIYGPIAAAKAFAEAVNGKTDATVASNTSAILDLSNTKEKLSGNGALNIGFIGDSVTFGHGPVTPWPSFFSDSLKQTYSSANIKALNAAKSGSTSSWGNENINSLLLDKGYNDLVFLSHGTNDQYYIGGYAESYANYVSMIKKIYASNPDADIVFVFCGRDYEMKGIYSISGGSISPFMKAMIDVALEYDLAIIDPMTTLYEACAEYAPDSIMGKGWKHYMQDEVHPNVIGQELYGEIVYQYVSKALK